MVSYFICTICFIALGVIYSYFLDIFVNTKMDEGPCPKVHSENLKAQFQKSRDVHMFDSLIEREFNSRISEADRVIKVR